MNYLKILQFMLLALLLSSCNLEHRIAKVAGAKIYKSSILLLFPESIIKTNSKPYKFDESLTEAQKYWQSIDSSDFLKYINDSIVKLDFQNYIIRLYKDFGFEVYQEKDLASFLQVKTSAYILDISQLEIEEYWKNFVDEQQMPDDNFYKQKFSLNALSLNAWIKVTVVNDSTLLPKLIFTQNFVNDEIDGYFHQNEFTGEINYSYNLKPLELNQINDFIKNSTIKISLDIIDFIANSYIENRLLQSIDSYPSKFWRYRPNSKKLSSTKKMSGYVIIKE